MSVPNQLNNPGDLRPTDPSQPTMTNSSGAFRQFDSPGKGFEALLNDIQSKISGKTSTGLNGNSSLAQFASVYAPASENNSGQYAVNLANQLKVRPDTTIGSLQPRIGEFAKAIANNEGYKWADQPAQPTDGQNGQPGLGEQILDAGKPIADWMFKNVVPLEAAATGALALGGPIAAGVTAGGGILSKAMTLGKEGLIGLGLDKAANFLGFGGGQPPTQPTQTQSQSQGGQPDVNNLMSSMAPQVNASKDIYHAYQDALNKTQSGRVALNDPTMRESLTNMSVSGRMPDTSNGFMDFTHAGEERTKEAQSAAKMEMALVGEGKMNTSEAVKHAISQIDPRATPNERADAIRHIRSEAASYGKSISLASGVQARHQQYASAGGSYNKMKKSSAQLMAHKALGHGFREAIKGHTLHKEEYEKILKHQQNLLNEKKIHKLLNEKKAPETNKFTKTLHQFGTRALATYIGDRVGGVLGAVLGNVVLTVGSKAADKHFGSNVFESARVKAGLKVLKETLPNQYDILKSQLEKKGVKFPSTEEKGKSSEEGLIKDMKKGGVTKSEKVLTDALKMSKEQLIRKKNPSALAKSRAINKAKNTRKVRLNKMFRDRLA